MCRLSPNINHAETAFGDRFCRWGFWRGGAAGICFKERGISTRADSEMTTDFRRPIDGAMTATGACRRMRRWRNSRDDAAEVRSGRMTIESQILCGHSWGGTRGGLRAICVLRRRDVIFGVHALAQLPQLRARIGPGDSAKADFAPKVFTTFRPSPISSGRFRPSFQQDRLMLGRGRDATLGGRSTPQLVGSTTSTTWIPRSHRAPSAARRPGRRSRHNWPSVFHST